MDRQETDGHTALWDFRCMVHRPGGQKFLYWVPFLWEGQQYLVHIYVDARQKTCGAYHAATALGPEDWVISDGGSPEEVLRKQQDVLPLAILSRAIRE
jgi:hypothetical protein